MPPTIFNRPTTEVHRAKRSTRPVPLTLSLHIHFLIVFLHPNNSDKPTALFFERTLLNSPVET